MWISKTENSSKSYKCQLQTVIKYKNLINFEILSELSKLNIQDNQILLKYEIIIYLIRHFEKAKIMGKVIS